MTSEDAKRKRCTLLLIQNDCETLKGLVQKNMSSIFALGIIPYMALFCRSFQEYTNKRLLDPTIDAELFDIRNSIKYYQERYARNKKRFLSADEEQDKEFRDLLRFDFLKNWNIHDNIGIYFEKNRHIIGNTQLMAELLNLSDLPIDERRTKMISIGSHVGEMINSVSIGLSKANPAPSIQINSCDQDYYYYDLNTNVSSFFNSNDSKDRNLYILHLLSILGFVRYVLEPMLDRDSTWIFRIKYLTTHYSFWGLKNLDKYLQNSSLDNDKALSQRIEAILMPGEHLFVSGFRNCMMHYDLIDGQSFAVSEEYFNETEPLFGLVESYFSGLSYFKLFDELSSFAAAVEQFLMNQFDFRKVHPKRL